MNNNQNFATMSDLGKKMMPTRPWILSTGPDENRVIESNNLNPNEIPQEGVSINIETNVAPLSFRESWAILNTHK